MLIQLIIIQAVTFLVIILVLKKLLYSETAKEAQRLRQLKDEFAHKEKELQVKIDAAKKDAVEKIAKAEQDAQKYIETKNKEADELKDTIVAKAHSQAEEMVRAALNAKEKMREEVYNELKDNVPAAAARIFREILPNEAREMMHDELVKDVIEKIKKMNKEILKTKSGKGELLTPYPVKKAEKERISSAISEKTGCQVTLTEKEDKDLVAGIVIKLDSLVIDGSLDNKLRQMEEKIG